jgi:UDP-N-acetylglucosamine--N-acetylmuramyl-(pentapeptide) pyrophosphoryl-undecaprenol N-acetylglucosamine transferase
MEERIIRQTGLPLGFVASGALRGRAPWGLVWNLVKMKIGYFQALAHLLRFRPAAVLATGGYGCVPAALAARTWRIPVLVYLPDLRPGMAVRFLARVAQRVAITASEAARYLPAGKTVVTGYPVRPELQPLRKAEARKRMGLPENANVMLVVGGSRGARTLNMAIADALPQWVELGWVVHSCGPEDLPLMTSKRNDLPAPSQSRYLPFAYLEEEMSWALSAADLAICRAGASTLGELPAFGLPAVLVPYPYAGEHQKWNAVYLAEQGAAVIMPNAEAQEGNLLPLVRSLFAEPGRLAAMASQARTLATPEAADSIAWEVIKLAGYSS